MNILVITPYYLITNNDKLTKQTEVVHYFTKYWSQAGHNVLVVHLYYHKLKKTINIFNALASFKYKDAVLIEIDGVKTARIECYRWKPSDFRLFSSQKKNIVRFVAQSIEKSRIFPDRIITHFPGCTTWLMESLKVKYNCPQIGVFHNIDIKNINKQATSCISKYPQIYDALGFRSINLLKEFEETNNVNLPKYVFNSGVDETILPTLPKQYIENQVVKLLFAGRLLPYKNVKYILEALTMIHGAFGFEFTIIGDGPCKKELQEYVSKNDLMEKVEFVGKIPRTEVFEYMKKANIFITVSYPETFGLVYLEAMACGALVIGCKKTGVAGIIIHGENGFLVEQENSIEILETLKYIHQLSLEEKNKILLNSFNTISQLGDKQMADYYLDCIQGMC